MDVHVDKIFEVPVEVEKIVENRYDVDVLKANITPVSVQIPEIHESHTQYEVPVYKETTVETVQEIDTPYNVERIHETPVNVDVHVNVERIQENPVWVETIQPREYTVENIIEVCKDVYVDKEVKIRKVVEVPVVNPIIKRVPREKIVEVIQEVVKPVVVEVEEFAKDIVNVNL